MIADLQLTESIIHLIGKHMRFCLPNINGFTNNRRKYQIYNIVMIFMILRAIINIFIRDEFISLYILSDFSYNWMFRIQWNLYELMTSLFVISQQIVFYLNYRNEVLSQIMVEMSIKKMSSKTINLYKYIKLFIRVFYICLGLLFAILTLYNSYYLNCSLLLAIIWAISYFIWIEFVVKVHFWKLIAFSLYCYRSKILLRTQNNNLNEMINKTKFIEFSSLLNCLKNLNQIYIQINDWNKIWRKYIALNLIYFSYSIGLIGIQLYSSQLNIITKIILYNIFTGLSITLSLFMQVASSINTEAKHTYNILTNYYSLKYTHKPMHFSTIHYKIKVLLIKFHYELL